MPYIGKKSLGQHFLTCAWVGETLVHTADISRSDTILEIGPGKGALTRLLASRAARVIAVEKDERLAEALEKDLQSRTIKNVEIIPGDILTLCPRLSLGQGYKVVANIPYYLTSRLLRLLLEGERKPALMALTIQKEVAERIVAKPPRMNPALTLNRTGHTIKYKKSKGGMNLLALSVQAYGKPEIIKTVPASCFSPKPKVDSAIIKISDISDRYFKTNSISEEKFFRLVKQSFSQKRKVLTNTFPPPKSKGAALLKRLNLSPNVRAEELSLNEWAQIVKEWYTT